MKDLPDIDYLRTRLSYDPGTGLLTWLSSGRRGMAGKVAASINHAGYVVCGLLGKTYMAHRLAWALHYGEKPPLDRQVDHINRDRKDNRIANLRLVRPQENQWNMEHKTALPTGVYAVPKSSKNPWGAHICVNSKRMYLGLHPTPEAAHAAYLAAKLKYHQIGATQ